MVAPENRSLLIAWDPLYAHPLPEGHRFPMEKYALIPQQLLYEGEVVPGKFFSPGLCADDVVTLTHTRHYLEKLKNQQLTAREQRLIGFPQSPALTVRELMITQGTVDCCRLALQHGVAMNVAGGTHHAFADHGEGFCLLNDFAVAANYLLREDMARRILIIDLDVHQGNGTAKIFADCNEVFTFSMHGRHNYPFRKERSSLDIELEDGTGDEHYLALLRAQLTMLMRDQQPDFVFYLSGVDILRTDRFGKLGVTIEGCAARDAFVFETVRHHKIPCVVAMGGGYSPQLRTIVDAHCNTFRLAKRIFNL